MEHWYHNMIILLHNVFFTVFIMDSGGTVYILNLIQSKLASVKFKLPYSKKKIYINPFLTAQSTQIESVISVPIKDFIHHYPRALFNDIPRVGGHFYDMPGSGRTFTTYPGRPYSNKKQ